MSSTNCPTSEEAAFPLPPIVVSMRQIADASFNDAVEILPIHHWEARTIPHPTHPIPVRIYSPDDRRDRPLLLYFHGGGFVIHNLASHDSLCRKLAISFGCVVVSVGYRLAPEHPYPAAIEDGYAALCWAAEHARELGCAPEALLVAGDSAGATLSAALSILARDRKGPAIRAQLLFYGAFGCIPNGESQSVREFDDGKHILTKDMLDCFDEQYLRGCSEEAVREPTCRPGTAADLTRLPPALVITAQYDPLRDDGEAYAGRLREAGNKVLFRRIDEMLHGFLLCWDHHKSVRDAIALIAEDVQQLLKSGS